MNIEFLRKHKTWNNLIDAKDMLQLSEGGHHSLFIEPALSHWMHYLKEQISNS